MNKKILEEHIKVISLKDNILELELSEEGEELLKQYRDSKKLNSIQEALQEIIKQAVYLHESKQRINSKLPSK